VTTQNSWDVSKESKSNMMFSWYNPFKISISYLKLFNSFSVFPLL